MSERGDGLDEADVRLADTIIDHTPDADLRKISKMWVRSAAQMIRAAFYWEEKYKEAIQVVARLERLEKLIATQGEKIMSDLDALTAQVAAQTEVEQSAILLIQNLAAEIAAAGTDPVALGNLVTQLRTSAVQLGNAVAANTPAAPASPATPVVPAAPASPATPVEPTPAAS